MRLFKNKFISIGFVVLLLVIPVSLYLLSQYQKMQDENQKTQLLLKQSQSTLGAQSVDNDQIIKQVGKLIELPSEIPSLEEITDASLFKNQPFFSNSQNGDIVLVFNNAKKVIIYREAINKIIDVGVITEDQSTPSPEAIPTDSSVPASEPSPTPEQ